MMTTPSIYPLDKNRKLISTTQDADGTVHKRFRLYSDDAKDSIDINLDIHYPRGGHLKPVDEKWRIVQQEKDEEGYLHKLVVAEGPKGELKEYFMEEKLPEKRKALSDDESSDPIPSKRTKRLSEKNTWKFLQTNRKKIPQSEEFLRILQNVTLTDLKEKFSPVISTEDSESLPVAFQKLIDHKISSMPVRQTGGDETTYYAFLDIVDLVSWIVDLVGNIRLIGESVSLEGVEEFSKATVKDVIKSQRSYSSYNVFRPFPMDSLLSEIMKELSQGTHRVPVIDSEGKLVTVFTQSSALKFIKENMESLGHKKDLKVEDISVANQYVLSVQDRDSAIDAFKLMKIARLGGVGVVNDMGTLVGNVSGRDIKKISSSGEFMKKLFQPLAEYLGDQIIVCAKMGESLQEVVDRMVTHHLHRIYIISSTAEPLGVLTLSDLLSELLERD